MKRMGVIVVNNYGVVYYGKLLSDPNKSEILLGQARLVFCSPQLDTLYSLSIGEYNKFSVSNIVGSILIGSIYHIFRVSDTDFIECKLPNKSKKQSILLFENADIRQCNDCDTLNINGHIFIKDVAYHNFYKGRILTENFSFKDCYVTSLLQTNGVGSSLKESYMNAFSNVMVGSYNTISGSNIFDLILSKYPDPDTELTIAELFELHFLLCNDCTNGRMGVYNKLKHKYNNQKYKDFFRYKFSIRKFIEESMTMKNNSRIKLLAKKYNIKMD